MRRVPCWQWLWALLLFASASGFVADTPADEQFFENQVRPLLVERCYECHGGDAKKPKGGLRLTSRGGVLAGGDSGPAAVAGKPDESLLIQAIQYRDEPKMPPDGKLKDREIEVLTRWVAQGLAWPEKASTVASASNAQPFRITEEQRRFWSFHSVRPVDPPAVKDSTWPRSDIDRFLLSAMETKSLAPAKTADKQTLIRRASFDLTGLPPSPEDVAAFLRDESEDAYAKLIDRLLATPAYGERWARHWLDLVRYADSLDARGVGAEGDIREAWRYRDWVVDALNADMPYDEFVRNQIAGDLLPAPNTSKADGAFNVSGTIASTMLAIGNWGNGDADKDKILTDIADDQLDVVCRTFMGLTVACARCHDHKFDPISQRDYYALAGIFFSTHILAKLTPKGAGEQIQSIPLASKVELKRRDEYAKRVANLEKSLNAQREQQAQALARTLKSEAGRYVLAAWDYQNRGTEKVAESFDTFASEHGLIAPALRQWIDRLGLGNSKPLSTPLREILGNAGVYAWKGSADTPSITANASEKSLTILSFTLPPRSISVHPGPTSGVVVGWQSPIAGKVRMTGRLADGDAGGGDGVGWLIERRNDRAARTLASGDIPNGGTMAFGQGLGADSLASVEVKAGDWLRLIVLPKTSHTCDTTTVDLVISSWDSPAAWDLTRDCSGDLLAGNPHSDRIGNNTVWHFDELAGVRSTDAELERLLSSWRKAVSEGQDRASIERAANELGASYTLEDRRSPFWLDEPSAESAFPSEAREHLRMLREELERLKQAPPPPLPFANAAQDGGVPESPHAGAHDVRIHHRGRYDRLGDLVPRGFPEILVDETSEPILDGSGRVQLARWLTRPDHPLTARVMVNRLWQHHFGAGLVRTPSNFGKLGERPTHPELLDWLAWRFVQDGWSLKLMHRRIMLSAAYRQSSEPSAEALRLDADNRLFARMSRQRLEAEAVRDNLLAISGRLDTTRGGPAMRDFHSTRRSLYIMTIRSTPIPFASLFDAADSTGLVDTRTSSTVAPQSLFFLNNSFALEQARVLAQRVIAEGPNDDRGRIGWLYRRLYARPPTDEEVGVGTRWLAPTKTEQAHESLEAYCQVLICANEFLYVD
jgi:cytochrome c553